MIIDNLLTEYVDSMNEGKNPDIGTFLERCPENLREELKSLIETSVFIKRNLVQEDYFDRSRAKAHELVHQIHLKRINNPAVNEVTILNDDAPPDEASALRIVQSHDGDIWIGIIPGSNDNMQHSIRIRTFGGGGSHSELVEDFVNIIRKAKELARKTNSIKVHEG